MPPYKVNRKRNSKPEFSGSNSMRIINTAMRLLHEGKITKDQFLQVCEKEADEIINNID